MYFSICGQESLISIHAPRKGSDLSKVCFEVQAATISIHASRKGSDISQQEIERAIQNFNPRFP